MKQVSDYVGLIPPYNAGQPKFSATVSFSVAGFSSLQAFFDALPSDFDLDVAVGAQLDIVGEWIGQSRNIRVPIDGVYFSFDDALRGFDRGVWKGPYDQEYGITSLDDETYRRLLRAKVLANGWDGLASSAETILAKFFNDPATYIFVQDNGGLSRGEPGNMSMIVGVAGQIPSSVDLQILGQGLIPTKPGGVGVEYEITSVQGAPLFGFDVSNDRIAGFDAGAWGVAPDAIAALPLS